MAESWRLSKNPMKKKYHHLGTRAVMSQCTVMETDVFSIQLRFTAEYVKFFFFLALILTPEILSVLSHYSSALYMSELRPCIKLSARKDL